MERFRLRWLTMFVMIPMSVFMRSLNTLMRHFAHMKKHEPTSPSYRCEIQEGRVISTEMCLRNGVFGTRPRRDQMQR
jgi:hypothetical protein